MTHEALLTNRDATIGPQPYVKWSHEPPRAQEVPGAIGRRPMRGVTRHGGLRGLTGLWPAAANPPYHFDIFRP